VVLTRKSMNVSPSGLIKHQTSPALVELPRSQSQRPEQTPHHPASEFNLAAICKDVGVQVKGNLADVEPIAAFLVTTGVQYFEQRHARIGAARITRSVLGRSSGRAARSRAAAPDRGNASRHSAPKTVSTRAPTAGSGAHKKRVTGTGMSSGIQDAIGRAQKDQ